MFAHTASLWTPEAHILVAVSGGPDSVALLDLLTTFFAPEDHLQLTITHIHHGLRESATNDAKFVQQLAKQYNLPFVECHVDVLSRVAETGESIEDAARQLRYACLQETAQSLHAHYIATGHTADDQAETVLMRVLRGAGLAGLAAIPPRRDNIIRPLLSIWRQDVEAYLSARNLQSCLDETNTSTCYTRNRIRLTLLPHLEAEYAPRLRERLCHLAEMAREDNAVLEQLVAEQAATMISPISGGVVLALPEKLSSAFRRRLYRSAITLVRGGVQDIGYDHLQAIEQVQAGGEVHLPGVRVLSEAGRLVFLKTAEIVEGKLFIPTQSLSIPGRCYLQDAGCSLEILLHIGQQAIEAGDVAVLDAHKIHGALSVRAWQPGDRYRPFGAPGSRKLQDIFVDAGVPRRLRDRIPVIIDENGIVWIAGFRPADRVKIVSTTTTGLRIKVEWELNPWTLQRLNAR